MTAIVDEREAQSEPTAVLPRSLYPLCEEMSRPDRKESALTGSRFANLIGLESSLHVISRKKLLEAVARYPELAASLDAWYRVAKSASWSSLMDVRRQLATADAAGRYTVFNIKGNAYRLIAEIYYESRVVLVRAVLTHAEYDKEGWKK